MFKKHLLSADEGGSYPDASQKLSGYYRSAQQSTDLRNEPLSPSVSVTLRLSGADLHTDGRHGLLLQCEEAENFQLAHGCLVQFSAPCCW